MKISKLLFKHFIPLLLLVLLVGVTACSDEVDNKKDPHTTGEFILNYHIEDVQTRVAALAKEMSIHDVYIAFYSDDKQEKLITSVKAELIPNSYSVKFALPAELEENESYKTIIVGNMDNYLNESSFSEYLDKNSKSTYSDLLYDITAIAKDDQRIVTPLPYAGVLLGANGKETLFITPSKTESKINASIRFTRSVSRIDFVNAAASDLKVAWVKVANYRTQGSVFHSTMALGDIIPGDSDKEPSKETPGYIEVDEPVEIEGVLQQFVKGGLYTFSNMVANTLPNDAKTTCLLIGGYYKGSNELTYYRANVSEKNRVQVLRRNHVYSITVTKVKGKGYETEHEALNGIDPQIDVEVGDEWETDEGNLIVDDDGNYLNVSKVYLVTNSNQGDTGIIHVAVKKGTVWDIRAVGDNLDKYFKINILNDKSFQVVTTSANDDSKSRFAKLEVFVKGKEAILSQEVIVVQMTSKEDSPILTVDDKTGVIDVEVPSSGGQYTYKVLTGNSEVGWSVSNQENSDFIKHTESGINETNLKVTIDRNASESKRQGQLVVKRNEGNVPHVLINFIQVEEADDDIFYTEPPLPIGEVVLEGFYPATENYVAPDYIVDFNTAFSSKKVSIHDIKGMYPYRNGYNKALSFEGYKIYLKDKTHNNDYDFIVSGIEFNPNNELVLTEHLTNANHLNLNVNYTNAHNSRTMLKLGPTNNAFNICYYSTGPGDKDIVGKVKVRVVPKNVNSTLPSQTKEISIRITTSAVLGDPIIGNGDFKFQVADRNYGTYSKYVVKNPLNYNNSLENHPDHDGVINPKPNTRSVRAESANVKFIGVHPDLSEFAKDPNGGNNYLLNACQEFAQLNYKEETDLDRWTLFTISEPMIRKNGVIKNINSGQSAENLLGKHVTFSKGRMFVYSTERNADNKFVGTYLPHHNLEPWQQDVIDYISYMNPSDKNVQVTRFKNDRYTPTSEDHVRLNTVSIPVAGMPKAMIRCMKFLGDLPSNI